MKLNKLSDILFKHLLLSIIIPSFFIIVFALSVIYINVSKKDLTIYNNFTSTTFQKIYDHLDNIDNIGALLEDSTNIRTSLIDISNSGISRDSSKELAYIPDIPITSTKLLANRAISAVIVYDNKNNPAYHLFQNTTTDLAFSRCNTVLLSTQNILTDSFILEPQDIGYLYYVTDYTDIYTGKSYGQVVFELFPISVVAPTISSNNFSFYEHQVNLNAYPSTYFIVYDAEGEVVLSSDHTLIGTNVNYRVENSSSLNVIKRHIDTYRLTIEIVTQKSEIYKDTYSIMPLFAIICIVFLGFIYQILRDRFTKNVSEINQIVHYFEDTENSLKTPLVLDSKFYETTLLKEYTQAMQKNVEDLQNAIVKNHIKLKDYEVQVLQSQINPHFVFNMLEIIGWKAVQDNSTDVSKMIQNLGQLLHSNIKETKESQIVLSMELDYTKNYLSLQQVRFENNFTYSINVDEDIVDKYYMLSLSIQPIVENCVIHGFSGIDYIGNLEIDVWEDIDEIYVSIRDNGKGFDTDGIFDETENPIFITESNILGDNNHIALKNIRRRIKMMYGEKYDIVIDSKIGKGTEVRFSIPILPV